MSSLGGPPAARAGEGDRRRVGEGARVHGHPPPGGELPGLAEGDEADATCYGIAIHYRPNASGRNARTFVGSYDLGLRRLKGRWRIHRFTLPRGGDEPLLRAHGMGPVRVRPKLGSRAVSGGVARAAGRAGTLRSIGGPVATSADSRWAAAAAAAAAPRGRTVHARPRGSPVIARAEVPRSDFRPKAKVLRGECTRSAAAPG
jgi:hypothetical protein